MRSSIISISLVCIMGMLTTPVTSRVPKALHYRGPENSDILLDSNAIPPELGGHLNSFFSQLTPDTLRTLLRVGNWADEVPYAFQPDPDAGTRIKGYQELYNEFLESRNQRF